MTTTLNTYADLIAWQKAISMVEFVYVATKKFPKEELYGLTSQVRRSAVSIPSNIAEGHGRNGRREFAHHLSIALGSLSELETQMEIAFRLGYVARESADQFRILSSELGRIMVGLKRSLEKHAVAS